MSPLKSPIIAVSMALVTTLAACTRQDPPTLTPAPTALTTEGVPLTNGQPIIITVAPPPGDEPARPVGTPLPLDLALRDPVADPQGLFRIDVPRGWLESRQQMTSKDIRLGTAFNRPGGGGLVSVTQFDNGRRPTSLGFTANQVLQITGFTTQQDFREFNREKVLDREDEAMRVDVGYTTPKGTEMRSLVLFQIDGTTFSMVNVAIPDADWSAHESEAREILRSYKGPSAVPAAASPAVAP
ncbi:MAG TPA: hypothetical protein PK826_04100 [Anaerolineae bacterium]|nr:hypothetical protein [Ardenticatenia bacterium]HQZ70502.1 hypothetical protein [Anaerolineae bacterium]HRA19364.1 hypothetical protein [Anaerolineae bacterium]